LLKVGKLTTGLGKRLREERERLGMTQEEFGALGGVLRETQYLYEQGKRTPSVEYLLGVVAGGASLEFLAFGERGRDQRQNLCLDREVLAAAYKLVDEFVRDSKGQPFSPGRRARIFDAICEAVAGKSQSEIDWSVVSAWSKALVTSKK